jgi:dynein light intermediate chain
LTAAAAVDELIRQVTISSPERGLLLLRLRDELRMSIAAYQSLYAASITFGQRKAQQAEMGREELTLRLQQTDDDRLSINRQIAQLKAVYEQMDKVSPRQHSSPTVLHATAPC